MEKCQVSDTVEWRHSRRSARNIYSQNVETRTSLMGGAQGAYRRDGLPWVRMPYGPGFYVFKGAREDEAVTAVFLTQ